MGGEGEGGFADRFLGSVFEIFLGGAWECCLVIVIQT